MRRFLVPLLCMGSLVSLSAPVMAETVCMPTTELRVSLIDWYEEEPVAEPNKAQQQIWASPRTGTWTMVKYTTDGQACVLDQGEDWLVGTARAALIASLQD